MSQVPVFLSLGSNIQPDHYLPEAASELQNLGQIAAVSHVWQSAPWGDPHQPDFCNAAVLLESSLLPDDLSEACRTIEDRLDRKRNPTNKNAARTIDIDISLFGEFVGQIQHREIPDPDILTRPFVAVPLAELDPGFVHPSDGRTLGEIAASLGPSGNLVKRDDLQLR